MSSQPGTGVVDADERGIPLDKRRRFELLQDCREIIVTRLVKVVGEALDKMSEQLTSLAMEKSQREEQQLLFDAVSVVRSHRNDIESRFRRAFVDVFERRMFNNADAASAKPEEAGELSLVDDSVIHDQIAVDRLVRRAKSGLDPEEVLGVRARLAALVERDWFDENVHPVAPEAIFEALRNTLNEIGAEANVKGALLDAFEPYVSANLNRVYSNVNERLRSNRILPKIRPRVERAAAGKRAQAVTEAVQGVGAVETGVHVGHVAGGQGSPIAPAMLETFEQLMRQMSNGDSRARTSAAQMLADPGTFGMADLPIPSVQPPLIEALDGLQAEAITGLAAPAQLTSALSGQARDKGTALDQLTVEIVSLVFDYIYNDPRLSDPVKQQLLRLQVVAVKAALLDRSFFARRQHPMRRLIDHVTEACTDPDAEADIGSPLVDGLSAVIDWVLGQFDRDLSVFEVAIQRLDELANSELERRAARVAEVTRQAERIDAIARAQEDARGEIAARVDDATPEFVRDFLFRWWSEALASARVDAPADGPDWQEALRLGEQLLWSVAPKAPEEIPRLAALLPKMINGLLRGLRPVAFEKEARETFFNELLRWHTKAIERAKQSHDGPRERVRTSVRLRSDGTVQFRSLDAAPKVPETVIVEQSAVDELVRGSQIEIVEGDGAVQRVKVAWVSPSRKLYALTRYPDFARSIPRAELAAMFDAGLARMANLTPAVDRAIESVVSGSEARPVAA